MVLAKQWSVSSDSNENASLAVSWAFSFPLSTGKAQAGSPGTFLGWCQAGISVPQCIWILFGCMVPVCQRLAIEKWVGGGGSLNVTNRTRHTDIEARSLTLPKTQGGYKKPHTCPKIQLGVEKAGLEPQSRTLRKSTRCAITMMIKILPTLWGLWCFSTCATERFLWSLAWDSWGNWDTKK